MYESKDQPLLSRIEFSWRLASHAVIAVLVVIASIAIGVLGFIYFAEMSWHDAVAYRACALLEATERPARRSPRFIARETS